MLLYICVYIYSCCCCCCWLVRHACSNAQKVYQYTAPLKIVYVPLCLTLFRSLVYLWSCFTFVFFTSVIHVLIFAWYTFLYICIYSSQLLPLIWINCTLKDHNEYLLQQYNGPKMSESRVLRVQYIGYHTHWNWHYCYQLPVQCFGGWYLPKKKVPLLLIWLLV